MTETEKTSFVRMKVGETVLISIYELVNVLWRRGRQATVMLVKGEFKAMFQLHRLQIISVFTFLVLGKGRADACWI